MEYTTEEKQIVLKVFADNGAVCFAVSDNGIGIARRHVRKIFDSFYQVDNSLARKAEGCGLGLSIVNSSSTRTKARSSWIASLAKEARSPCSCLWRAATATEMPQPGKPHNCNGKGSDN